MSSNLSKIWLSGDLVQKNKLQKLIFPVGIVYDKQTDQVQIVRSNNKLVIKNGECIDLDTFSVQVTAATESSNFIKDLNSFLSFDF